MHTRSPAPTPANERAPLQPQLLASLAAGYDRDRLRRDAAAGLTVAIVALPLSMAIAIASGLSPERGLFTAIVGGFLISALGGSRHQIGGPAGAFIVLVFGIVERQGYEGLVLATAMAGVMMIALGLLRLGSLITLVPHAVTVGFTSGIGVIILASQLKDLFGMTLAKEPAAFLPKLSALAGAIGTVSAAAVAVSLATIATILLLRAHRPMWPGLLIAVAAASVAAALLGLGVATIGSRFGALPQMLPAPAWPDLSQARLLALLPDAITIALLGSVESLLSAVVADGMSGDRHRSDIELVGQGVANIGCAVFGGMPATGTIARTATNVRSGGTSPVAGMLHAAYLLAFMLVAAPLAAHIPLAALAGVLAVVSWNMIDPKGVAAEMATGWPTAAVLATTLLVTVFVDLIYGIGAGVLVHLAIRAYRFART